MNNQITYEEFEQQINILKQPIKTKVDWGEPEQNIDISWNNEEQKE